MLNNTKVGTSDTVKKVLKYKSSEESLSRFHKAYVWKVTIPGSTGILQNKMEMKGYFNVKIIGEAELWWTN